VSLYLGSVSSSYRLYHEALLQCRDPIPRMTAQRSRRPNDRDEHQNFNTSTRDNSTNMSSIEAALAAIDALEPGEPLIYSHIAKQYGCSRITLARRHQGISKSRNLKAQNRHALPIQQEQELLKYIKQLTERGLLPTRAMIQRFGLEIAKRELGVHWVDRYI
jgi:hypothetical protein